MRLFGLDMVLAPHLLTISTGFLYCMMIRDLFPLLTKRKQAKGIEAFFKRFIYFMYMHTHVQIIVSLHLVVGN